MSESSRKRGGSDSCHRIEEKKQRVEKWSDYLKITGLYPDTEDFTPWSYHHQQLKNIGKNANNRQHLIFTNITIPDFNLEEVVKQYNKTQPPEVQQQGFEAANEGTLRLIDDMNVFVRDNSRKVFVKNRSSDSGEMMGEVLALKIGSIMKLDPKPKDTAITPSLLEQLNTGLYRFLATDPKALDDDKRHKSRTTHDSVNTENLREGGPAVPIPQTKSRCINIHAYNTARNDNAINDIQLYRGPVDIWSSTRVTAPNLKEYLRSIYPLTQLTEKFFQILLPDFYKKYKDVYDILPVTYLTEEEKKWFEIWTSRGTVLSTFTDVHVDLKDVPLGFCAIIPLGKFTDGHVCLPSLGIKLTLQPGSILYLRSHLLPHYVGNWTGNRFSIIQYTHQSVFDYYTEQTGKQPFPFEEMPKWYKARNE